MLMRSIKPEIAERIRKKRVLCILIGHDELTSQFPQFATDKKGKELDFYNWRQRGFLRHIGRRPTVVFAEEDVMEYDGGMKLESIFCRRLAATPGHTDNLSFEITTMHVSYPEKGLAHVGCLELGKIALCDEMIHHSARCT
jgi:hypothetical protein